MTIIRMTEKEIRAKYPLTRELKRKIRAIRDDDIKDDEDGEWTTTMFRNAVRPGRPKSVNPKKLVAIRVDADVYAAARKYPGYSTRVNDMMRGMFSAAGVL